MEEIELRFGNDAGILVRSDTLSLEELIKIVKRLKDDLLFTVVLPDEDEGIDVA